MDLSGSMEGFGFRMTPGLEAYAKELAGGTSVALATTGDEFRCLRPAMDVTSPGDLAAAWSPWRPAGTVNWEAILALFRYLETRPGQKLAVLVADGGDDRDDLFPACQDLLAESPDIDDVVVYPEESGRGERQIRGETHLARLAEVAGGLVVRHVRNFELAVPRIADWLQGRAVVALEAAGVDREARPRVRVREGLPWRARVIADERRADPPHPRIRDVARPPGDARAMLERLGIVHAEGRVAARPVEALLESRWLPGGGTWHEGWWVADPGWFVFRGEAMLSCGGAWFSWPEYWKKGIFRFVFGRKEILGRRPIALRVPPFDRVCREIRSPADALMFLARERVSSGQSSELWPLRLSPVMLEGRSFLEWQRAVTEILVRFGKGYAEAVHRARQMALRRETLRIVGEWAAVAEGSPAWRRIEDRVREMARERAWWEDWEFLGGLLGDVTARTVGAEVDRRLAAAVLAVEAGSPTGDPA